jgi:hypothetical protein
MVAAALPAVVLGLEFDGNASAPWAAHALRPAPGNEVFPAAVRIGEVNDGLLERLKFGFHGSRVQKSHGVVKYIIATFLP